MHEIGTVLPVVLKSYMQRGESRMVDVLAPFWPRVAGKAIAANSEPVAFDQGTLILVTSIPSWAVQLRGMSEEIRSAVNSFLGGPAVKKLRVEFRAPSNLSVKRIDQEN